MVLEEREGSSVRDAAKSKTITAFAVLLVPETPRLAFDFAAHRGVCPVPFGVSARVPRNQPREELRFQDMLRKQRHEKARFEDSPEEYRERVCACVSSACKAPH
eukprot:3198133-Rhodomonas_salina.1